MIGRIIEMLGRSAGFSVTDWCYIATAVKELFLARIRHATDPIGKILRDLQAVQPLATEVKTVEVDVARVSWAIGAVAARVPWRSDCLLRVMAADRWLRRSRLRPEFFLGVGHDAAGQFSAHAWLRCNNVMITGGSGDELTPLITPSGAQTGQRRTGADASSD